jgi:hypothetical protein
VREEQFVREDCSPLKFRCPGQGDGQLVAHCATRIAADCKAVVAKFIAGIPNLFTGQISVQVSTIELSTVLNTSAGKLRTSVEEQS